METQPVKGRTHNGTQVKLMRQQKGWANRNRKSKCRQCKGRPDFQNIIGNTVTVTVGSFAVQ